MEEKKKKIFLIKLAYWLGIGADALWAIALFFPQIFGVVLGKSDFEVDLQTRLIMAIGGTLMAGWTVLLFWALRKPIERRVVILITAFPVVFGLFIVAFIGFLEGNAFSLWILVKSTILFLAMITSYVLARNINKEMIKKNLS